MRFLAVTILLALAPLSPGQGIVVKPEHRVPNRTDHGACWWAAMETAGNHHGDPRLKGLVGRVVVDGRGWKGGADVDSISHWMTASGVKWESWPGGNTNAGYVWLAGHLDRGRPVVVSLKDPPGTHAVLLVAFDRQANAVRYVDPNGVADVVKPWAWFTETWTGHAHVVWPPDRSIVQAPPPKPVEVVRDALEKKPVLLRPIEVRKQYPPVQPHEIPFRTEQAFNVKPPVVPSNQDIKDGVRRPDDTLRYGLFGDGVGLGGGHDYYRDFRAARVAPSPKPSP